MITIGNFFEQRKLVWTTVLGWALLAVKIEISINRFATFHKVGPGRGEHDGEKSFRARSYA